MSIPIEPSSEQGFTISGKAMSCEWSSFPLYDVAKNGVRIWWNAKIFLASALSCAR